MKFMLFAAAFGLVTLSSASAQTVSQSHFCRNWLQVCNRTCPAGPGQCGPTCNARHSACLAGGCFHFNRPGPRCYSNPGDRQMVIDFERNRRGR